MKRSTFGSSSVQRQSVLKPRNEITPNSRQSTGLRKLRTSSDNNVRLSQVTGRFTPTRSNIPRYTPVRNVPSTSNSLVPPAPSSVSRLSTDSVRNSSMGSKNRKETRNVGDPAFKSECVDKILEFLACNGFEYQVNRRNLLNPTTKDFTNIFCFIYRHFDPTFTLPHKFEEEIPRIMRLLKYPTQLSKSTFITVGSRHTWPTVLAMLAWMIDSLGIIGSCDIMSLFPTDFDLDSTTMQKRLVKFIDIYKCGGDSDAISSQLEDYHHTIESVYEVRSQDIISLQEYNEKLEEEIALASSGPERLEHLKQQCEQLINDKEKMNCYIRELHVHLTAKDTERAQLEANLEEQRSELLKLHEEQINLEAVKAKQALSGSELAKFKNHAKDVGCLITQLQAQCKELDSQICSQEMKLGKCQKEISEKVSCYNSLIRQLELGENFEIESNNIADSLQHWKEHILVDLYEFKKNSKHTAFETQNQKIRKDEALALVQENLKSKQDEASKLKNKLRRLDDDISMTKNEILTEEKEMIEENERLHQQNVEARKGHKSSLYQKQYSVDQAKEEFEATKAYGKERMRAGAEFLVKVCNRALDDLECKTNITENFKQAIHQSCSTLLETVKSSHK